MSRVNWLQAYAQYSGESESPDPYHLWMGLSVLSSALRRNVWLNQGIYILYPNMYVVLIGPPGLGKSTTIRLGRRILLSLDDVVMGPDSITREELIDFMARVGKKSVQSAVTLHSTELSSLIEPSGVKMIQFLIDIYDSDDEWRYSTKHQGKALITQPFINIVAGTVPKYLADDFPVQIINNGFTARTIFVYEESPRFANPFPAEPDPNIVELLKDDLKMISELRGEFHWDPAAKRLYKDQYNKIFGSTVDDYRLEDFHNRKKIHILKVAMLLAVSEEDDLIIRERDLVGAWTLLSGLEKNMAKAFSAVGKYEYATDLERIKAQIISEGQLMVKEIYRRNQSVGDADTIGRMLMLAERSGQIVRYRDEENNLWYKSAV